MLYYHYYSPLKVEPLPLYPPLLGKERGRGFLREASLLFDSSFFIFLLRRRGG